MAKPSKLVDKIFGAIFILYLHVIMSMPAHRIYRLISCLGILAYKFSKRHTRFARLNLRMCFPSIFNPDLDMNDNSDTRLERFIRRNYKHMFWAYVEGFIGKRLIRINAFHRFLNLSIHEETKNLLAERREEIKAGMKSKPIIFNTGHVGSWEIVAYSIMGQGIPINAVARPLDIESINVEVNKTRERYGLRIISKFGGMISMARTLLDGKSLLLVTDQDAGVEDTGIYADFFGHWCKCIESYAILALKYNVPIIPVYSFRHSDKFKFTIIWDKPIYPKGDYRNLDDVCKIVQDWHDTLAAQILRYPHQYEWYHKKWRTRPVDEENVQRPYETDRQTKKEQMAEIKKKFEPSRNLTKILDRYKEQEELFNKQNYEKTIPSCNI